MTKSGSNYTKTFDEGITNGTSYSFSLRRKTSGDPDACYSSASPAATCTPADVATCSWGTWSNWGTCNSDCQQSRTKTCNRTSGTGSCTCPGGSYSNGQTETQSCTGGNCSSGSPPDQPSCSCDTSESSPGCNSPCSVLSEYYRCGAFHCSYESITTSSSDGSEKYNASLSFSNASSDGDSVSWKCDGENYNTESCSFTRSDGKCDNTRVNGCSPGSSDNEGSTSTRSCSGGTLTTETESTWHCTGSYGGSTDTSCSYTSDTSAVCSDYGSNYVCSARDGCVTECSSCENGLSTCGSNNLCVIHRAWVSEYNGVNCGGCGKTDTTPCTSNADCQP